MNQCDKLLDYMKANGSISGLESIGLGVLNYKGRIADLRSLGFNIKTVMVETVNADGEKKRYARYYLQ